MDHLITNALIQINNEHNINRVFSSLKKNVEYSQDKKVIYILDAIYSKYEWNSKFNYFPINLNIASLEKDLIDFVNFIRSPDFKKLIIHEHQEAKQDEEYQEAKDEEYQEAKAEEYQEDKDEAKDEEHQEAKDEAKDEEHQETEEILEVKIEERDYQDDNFQCIIKNIMPVLEVFNRNVMESSLTLSVEKMFKDIDNEVDVNKENIYEKVLYIKRLFEKNKWTSAGFSSPPNKKLILEGLKKFFI